MCPICLDMLKNTYTTKECLHRFCQDCIITALRSGNKECPTCRKKLVSKRSLRPDPNFDALISKIYPSRDEYEAHQERVMAKLNKRHNTAALSTSIEEGLKVQALNRAQRVPPKVSVITREITQQYKNAMFTFIADISLPQAMKRPRTSDESSSCGDVEGEIEGEGSLDMPDPSNEIELVFKPHPDEIMHSRPYMVRYLKTSALASIDHLAKYLSMRIALDLRDAGSMDSQSSSNQNEGGCGEFTIFISTYPGQFQPLTGNQTLEQVNESKSESLNGCQTLEQVNERHWKANRPLEMYFLSKK
eukprot:XP_011684263.1 PREDICTED: E3 ubiquitin-protein ligase RING2-like [Strongylocentrotus purpuratus]